MKDPIFAVGDSVQSAATSSDVCLMDDRWVAVIAEVRHGVTGAPDGCAYVTHGRWASKPKAKQTVRQLWAGDLESI